MTHRLLLVLCLAGLGAILSGCRGEHFTVEDQWWLSLLDQPHRRGDHHHCVTDVGPNRPVHRGEASYCLTGYSDGDAVYRRDSAGTLVQGWRAWLIPKDEPARWHAVRDSLVGTIAQLVGDTPMCRDAVPGGFTRVTSWHVRSFELTVVTHEPDWGGLPAYEIVVALQRAARPCEVSAHEAA